MRDHPRSRGDNFFVDLSLPRLEGSPPLTRGQLGYAKLVSLVCRITPAHAGTTSADHVLNHIDRDHPRSRGDNAPFRLPSSVTLGSPPLTRGQLRSCSPRRPPCGITPAHAGTTPAHLSARQKCRDHPRSRGDNVGASVAGTGMMGSPPLTRGQLSDTTSP